MAALRDRYRERGMDVHGFDGDDNLLHVVVYGRITGAEVTVHTIALDGHLDEDAEPGSASPNERRTRGRATRAPIAAQTPPWSPTAR